MWKLLCLNYKPILKQFYLDVNYSDEKKSDMLQFLRGLRNLEKKIFTKETKMAVAFHRRRKLEQVNMTFYLFSMNYVENVS